MIENGSLTLVKSKMKSITNATEKLRHTTEKSQKLGVLDFHWKQVDKINSYMKYE